MKRMMLMPRPIELRPVEARHWMGAQPREPLSHTWFRAVAPLPDDPKIHRAVLAYASDMTLLGTATLPHGISWHKGNMMGASLDHAIWFHDDFRVDEWLLYVAEYNNHRIQVLGATSGRQVRFFGTGLVGNAVGQLTSPMGLCVKRGPNGTWLLLVAEYGNNRVQVFVA